MSTDVMTAAAPRAATGRYTASAQGLHWVSAALMLAVLVLAWVMESPPNGDASRATVVMLHKSVGLTILALTAARLVWRAIHPPPPAVRWAAWEAAAATASHWLLYLVLLAMPISGYSDVRRPRARHPVFRPVRGAAADPGDRRDLADRHHRARQSGNGRSMPWSRCTSQRRSGTSPSGATARWTGC